MKQKRSIGKTMLSICLAILLVLQTVAFPAAAFADEESGSQNVAESQLAPEVVDDTTSETPSDNPSSESEEVNDDSAEPSIDNSSPALEEGNANDASDEPSADSPSLTPEAEPTPQSTSTFEQMAVDPTDKTAVFMDANSTFPLKVTQGNDIAPGGTIQGRQAFTLISEGLKVPVNGDDPNPTNADPGKYIQKGDWIELKREDYFKEVVLPKATKTLNAQTETGMKQLGTAYFTPDSIRIEFNGHDDFFNGVGRSVLFSFETTANSDLNGIEYGDSKPISIFGGAYQLKNPDVTAKYNLTLTSPGMKNSSWAYRIINPDFFVAGAITWQSTVSAFDQFDNTIKLPLDGKTFYTNPASYNMDSPSSSYRVSGIYVPDSFKVNDELVEPTIDANGALSYVFPPGTGVDSEGRI
ncbi:hypothetical protein [Paenibacillus sp. Z3-2]